MKEGWEHLSLGTVCKVIAGQSPKGIFYNQSAEGMPFYQGKKEFGDKYINPPSVWTTQITKEAIEGDILMSVRAPVGPINFTTDNICIGRGLAAIRASKKIDREYLFYFLLSKKEQISGNEGAVFASINKKQIESIEISLPPLPEQKRIVAILDKAFEGIDKAIANTEKNLANAREVFETYLNIVFSQTSEMWKQTTLGDEYDVRDGTHDSPKYQSDGYALVTSKNLKRDGLVLDKINYISQEDYQNICRRSGVNKGDVLFAMIGTIGNPIVVENEPNFAIKNVALFKIPENRDGHFLKYYLNSNLVREKMDSEAKGTTQKFVGLGYLRNFPIHIPNPDIEKNIVKSLSLLENHTKNLESIYLNKLNTLVELKQSILQKAFSGELTKDFAITKEEEAVA